MHDPARLTGLLLAATLFATGCHSKTSPTPDNFTDTLNAYFVEHSDCLFKVAPRFPYETSDPAEIKLYDTLVHSQMLEKTEEKAIHVSRYTVTTTGNRYAPRFCYGHRAVTSIDSFTPPAAENGFPTTHVVYHYSMKDVPIWAESAEIKAAFPRMAEATSGTASDKAMLAGTMAGWQVPD
ncbi:MAG: hypothetical protein KGK08_11045 [Acidobacteriota bacterium]|nr:hypothetical protein [Acidobacteriota bacterium]